MATRNAQGELVFTQEEISQVQIFLNEDRVPEGYQFVTDVLSDLETILESSTNLPERLSVRQVRTWFEGAVQINEASAPGESAFADLIRFYTQRTGQLHFGESVGATGAQFDPYASLIEAPNGIQRASNVVAERAFQFILDTNRVPTLEEISNEDATGVGDTLFILDQLDTAFSNNSAWAGTILFSLLDGDETDRLLADRGQNLDDLNNPAEFNKIEDLRNIIFAVDAFDYALTQTIEFSGFTPNNITEVVLALPLADNVAASLINTFSIDAESFNDEFLLNATGGSVAAEAIEYVVQQGRAKLVAELADLFQVDISGSDFLGGANTVFAQLEQNGFLNLDITRIDNLSADAIIDEAQDSIAYTYALINLSPFVVEGDLSIYDIHNQNGELDLASYSDQFIQDRAEFLVSLIDAQVENTDSLLPAPGSPLIPRTQFTDSTTNATVTIGGGASLSLGLFREVRFGTNQDDAGANEIQGGLGDDHLFGLGGNDVIRGGDGDDYIEGGRGIDQLFGGDNRDTLVGGDDADILRGEAGMDTLQGGKGNDDLYGGVDNDILEGGADDDNYFFESGDGRDTIIDAEGINTIFVNGQRLSAATQITSGIAIFEDNNNENIIYNLLDNGDLFINIIDGINRDSLTIKDFGSTANNNFCKVA
ncbi:MAG: hypothetical protein COB94_003425 [Gammaproteobacteria bacterium]|nr:hypothetical protein [Gammaproteobacteria bacterium]